MKNAKAMQTADSILGVPPQGAVLSEAVDLVSGRNIGPVHLMPGSVVVFDPELVDGRLDQSGGKIEK